MTPTVAARVDGQDPKDREHEWRPCEGIRPQGVKRRYFCRVCHRRGTEREILMTISKECGGECYTHGVHPEES